MASKMLHTCLRVENLEKSIAFYQDAFGFKELRRKDFPDYAFTIVYLGLDGDDYELELTYNYDHGPYVVGDKSKWTSRNTTKLLLCQRSRWIQGRSDS